MTRAGIGEFWLPMPERFFSELWRSAPYGRKNKAPEPIVWGVCFWLLKEGQQLVQNKIRTWSGRSADYVRRLLAEVQTAYQTWTAEPVLDQAPAPAPQTDRQPTVSRPSADRHPTVNPDVVTVGPVEEASSAYRPVSVSPSSAHRQPESLYPRARTTETPTRTSTAATTEQAAAGDDALLQALRATAPGLAIGVARCLYLIGVKRPADLQAYESRNALCGVLKGLQMSQIEYACTSCQSTSFRAYTRSPEPPHCSKCGAVMSSVAPKREQAIRYLSSSGIPNVADIIERTMLQHGWTFGSVVLEKTVAADKSEVFDRPHQGVKMRLPHRTQLPLWLSQQDDYDDLVEASQTASEGDLLRWLTPRLHGAKGLLTAALTHLQTRQEVAA
tara:strand:+ start:75 stop:1235 length:1161 start_codon:yes stop_codon:yes gene_type:complete